MDKKNSIEVGITPCQVCGKKSVAIIGSGAVCSDHNRLLKTGKLTSTMDANLIALTKEHRL